MSQSPRTVSVTLNHRDDDGMVVDSSTEQVEDQLVSDIVDRSAQLLVVLRQIAEGNSGETAFDEALCDLEETLMAANLVPDGGLPAIKFS
jgi:hypothetical protein